MWSHVQVKQTTKTKRSTEVDEAPMFKVLVIGDEEYNREHVVLSIQDIVPDTDNTRVRCSLFFFCSLVFFVLSGPDHMVGFVCAQ